MNTAPAPGTPTQVAHPWKAVVRTVATYVVSAIAVVIAAVPIVEETLGAYLPEAWVAWLIGAAAVLGAVQLALTRIMALSQLQDLLVKVGLGTGVEREREEFGRYEAGRPEDPAPRDEAAASGPDYTI